MPDTAASDTRSGKVCKRDYPPITARGIDLHHVAKLIPHFSATAAQCRQGGAGTAEEKGVVVDFAGSVAGATQAWTDPGRLEQVVWNLLSNAVQASSEGGRVQLSVEVTETTLRLTVKDDGVGIDAADLAHIFEPFRQGACKGGTHRGLGLGLAIVRHIVTLSR